MKMHSFRPKELEAQQLNQLLISSVAPRPIALVSTVNAHGNVNLSPFSFFNIFSFNPPILIFSPSRRSRDNTTKHTYENVLAVPQVTISIVNHAMGQQTALSSKRYPKEVDEFVKAGLTPVKSDLVDPPFVGEAPVAFECVVNQVLPLGEEAGAGNLVISKIEKIHINEKYYCPEKLVDLEKLDLIGRLGGAYYCSTKSASLFEINSPETPIGIGFDQLPKHLLNSHYLTGNLLGKLAAMPTIPTKQLLQEFCKNADIKAILAEKNHDEKIKHLHLKAKKLIEANCLEEALLCVFLVQ